MARLTRRQLLAGTAGMTGAAVAGLALPRGIGFAQAPQSLTTTARRIVPVGSGVFKPLAFGAGQQYTVREIAPGLARNLREGRRVSLLYFGQMTDVHYIDAESPARVEYVEPAGVASGGFRPQETLSVQVMDSSARRMNSLRTSPLRGLNGASQMGFVMVTGDLADNAERIEVRRVIDTLDGRLFMPGTGAAAYEGVQQDSNMDRNYYHPGGTEMQDTYRDDRDFPQYAQLLAQGGAMFQATGLQVPWYAIPGNHDLLVQGNVAVNATFNALATGNQKVVALPPALQMDPAFIGGLLTGDPAALAQLLALFGDPMYAQTVTADASRALVSRGEWVEEFFTTTTNTGHGMTQANRDNDTAYYTVNPAPRVVAIALDTANANGDFRGSIGVNQFTWLETQLIANSSRYYSGAGGTGSVVTTGNTDNAIVVFTHHPIVAMTNPNPPGTQDETLRRNGPEFRDLLLRFPNVVLVANGHEHVNVVTPFARPMGSAIPGGFWEVNTVSHADWPQQGRLFELFNNQDGSWSIVATLMDGEADPTVNLGAINYASVSRQLAFNDPQEGPKGGAVAGGPGDGNVELLVPAPFALPPQVTPTPVPIGTPRPSVPPLPMPIQPAPNPMRPVGPLAGMPGAQPPARGAASTDATPLPAPPRR